MRQLKADHSCGPEIESEYELGGLLYRQIGRPLATQNAINVRGRATILVLYIGTVTRSKTTSFSSRTTVKDVTDPVGP